MNASGRLIGLRDVQGMIGVIKRSNWALIMAGGKGRRLAPLTDEVPKPMLPAAGRPILERLVLRLSGSGIRRILISIGHLGEQIEAYFGDGSEFGCLITYIREDPEQSPSTGEHSAFWSQLLAYPTSRCCW